MLIIFCDIRGIVHKEFVPPGQCLLPICFEAAEGKFLTEIWRNKDWFVHHDNAPAHAAIRTRQFLAKNNMSVVSHALYSPDLVPCDVFMFSKIKSKLKGRRFDTSDEIQAKLQEVLKALISADFEECFHL